MIPRDSALDPAAMAYARALLKRPEPKPRLWPAVAAAGVFAASAMALAVAMILAPPAQLSPTRPALGSATSTTLGAP